MQAIIKAQGAQKQQFKLGTLTTDVTAGEDGFVTQIDNYQVSKIARLAGAPMDKGAGVDLFKKLGDPVNKGESLYCIYAEFQSDFQFATALAKEFSGYTVGPQTLVQKPYQEI
jgi:thymidine phosphorylase